MKQAVAKTQSFRRRLDRGRPKDEQYGLQSFAEALEIGENQGLRDALFYKAAFDKVLIEDDYSSVKYYILQLGCVPNFLCSGAVFPEYDFNGLALQDLANLNVTLDQMTFSLIPTDSGGAAVFSWLGESIACNQFVASLDRLPDTLVPPAIMRFTFEHFENVCISPVWWDNLEDRSKQMIEHRFKLAASYKARMSDCLKDDGLRCVSWQITSRETNINF
jgi:hypothetical protein